MTREMSHSSSEKQKPSRKSHRKSRNGCDNCKRRRIKCNEVKPQCSNCIKHSDCCSFLLQHAPSTSSPRSVTSHDGLSSRRVLSQSTSPAFTPASVSTFSGSIGPSLQDPCIQPAFSILDMELLHNYETSTCYTLSNIPSMQTFMRISMPKMGFTHPFVLHSLLSVSALHLSRFKKEAADFYVSQAEHHYAIALNIATSLMPNIDQDNCAALYSFATFCSTYHLAMGPKSGDFLLFTDNGVAEWRLLFRGVRAIIEANLWLLQKSELAPMFEVSIRQLGLPSGSNPHLQDLREHIVETSSDHPKFDLYIKTLDLLGESYLLSPTTGARGQSSLPLTFTWLYRVSDEFVQSLQEREPIALVIFAHFCVLLHDMSFNWWLTGWVDHLMSGIYSCLSGEHKIWLSWPIEEIGCIPQ